MLSAWQGAANAVRSIEAPRFHRAARRRGGGMTSRGAGAAVEDQVGVLYPGLQAAMTSRVAAIQSGLRASGFGTEQFDILQRTTTCPRPWRERMKELSIGDVTIISIIERDGPWRTPQEMFPAYEPINGKRHLAELDP